MDDKWINEKELAKMLGIAVQTVRGWRFKRQGPPYYKVGRMIRYDLSEAVQFMDRHRVNL